MPMHDWTRVDPNDYHTFDLLWIASLATALNHHRLPDGYYAMADHTTPPIVPDVVTLSAADAAPVEAGGVAVETVPQTAIAATEPGRKTKVSGRRRVAIRHARDRRLVAVVEIVSPSNKARKAEFADLVGKTVQLLRQGVHVLLIDPFPPTARDPDGIHAAVWKELTGKRPPHDAARPLTLASYTARGDDTYSAFVEPLAAGDRLADMPLFLTGRVHVPTPLEETYRAAWDGFPAPLRAVVEGP